MPPEVTAKRGLFVSLKPHSLRPEALCLTAPALVATTRLRALWPPDKAATHQAVS